MRLPALSLVSFLLPLVAARDVNPYECKTSRAADEEACAQPIEDVIAVTPGSFYTAKIRCYDCPYLEYTGKDENRERKVAHGDNDLFFNVTLSHDNSTLLLNNQPFFPKLRTIPEPPSIQVPQLPPSFTYTNLSYALTCRIPSCNPPLFEAIQPDCHHWCYELQLGSMSVDYLYINQLINYNGDDDTADALYWEVGVDILAGHDGYEDDPTWPLRNPSQKMLKIVVAGTEAMKQSRGKKNTQAPDSLFESVGEDGVAYTYRIADVKLVDREYDFPAKEPDTFMKKVSRFFGNDVWQKEGRLVFIHEEWGYYGKIGTLRNMFGEFIHWDMWELIFVIVGSTVGGLLALFGIYKLFFWVLQQRELMQWNGMDDIWDKLKREREEEENALLNGRYTDDPDGEGSSGPLAYTDDVDKMKPLPTKPLPDKPLPDLPLIDA